MIELIEVLFIQITSTKEIWNPQFKKKKLETIIFKCRVSEGGSLFPFHMLWFYRVPRLPTQIAGKSVGCWPRLGKVAEEDFGFCQFIRMPPKSLRKAVRFYRVCFPLQTMGRPRPQPRCPSHLLHK